MKIRALPPERIRRHDRLRAKPGVAYRALELDLLERGHRCLSVFVLDSETMLGEKMCQGSYAGSCSHFRTHLSFRVRKTKCAAFHAPRSNADQSAARFSCCSG